MNALHIMDHRRGRIRWRAGPTTCRTTTPLHAMLDARLDGLHAALDTGAFDRLDEDVAPLLRDAHAAGRLDVVVQAHAAASLAHYRRNHMGDSAQHAVLAHRLAGSLAGDDGAARVRAEGRVALARMRWAVGDLDAALHDLDEVRRLLGPAPQGRAAIHASNLRGLVQADLGALGPSVEAHEEALAAARAAGIADLELAALSNVAGRLLAIGDAHAAAGATGAARAAWSRIVALFDDTHARMMALGLEHGLPHLLVSYGAALLRLDRGDEAEAAFARQRALVARHGDRTSLLHAAPVLAAHHRAHGDPSLARAVLTEAIATAAAIGARAREAALHLALSRLEEDAGCFDTALAHFKRFHALRGECAADRASERSRLLAVELGTERALAEAQEQRERAHALAQANAGLVEQAATLMREAITDPLTGLANRRELDRCLAVLWDAARAAGAPLFVALLDVDHFKQVNDTWSHAVGDAVLSELGPLLRRHCRGGDLAARYGGEEFVLAFPGLSRDGAVAVCDRLREAVQRHHWPMMDAGFRVTLSIGVSDLSAAESVGEGLAAADARLREAKQLGRNRMRVDP